MSAENEIVQVPRRLFEYWQQLSRAHSLNNIETSSSCLVFTMCDGATKKIGIPASAALSDSAFMTDEEVDAIFAAADEATYTSSGDNFMTDADVDEIMEGGE